MHGSDAVGNRSREFADFRTPDHFTLSAFGRLEHGRPGRRPLMAEIPLVTSHYPWTPVPRTVGWGEVGDGTVYDTIPGAPDVAVWSDPTRIRAAYQESIAYSLESLMSWVQTYGDDDLVLVFLGDHQPSPVVTGADAGHDVPMTMVTRGPAVLDRVGAWGWDVGPAPGPQDFQVRTAPPTRGRSTSSPEARPARPTDPAGARPPARVSPARRGSVRSAPRSADRPAGRRCRAG